jgi:hypothetical protein
MPNRSREIGSAFLRQVDLKWQELSCSTSSFSMQLSPMRRFVLPTLLFACFAVPAATLAQKQIKKHNRATPPTFKPNEFDGVFFPNAVAQLQGDRPKPGTENAVASNLASNTGSAESNELAGGKGKWNVLISESTIEDLMKESKSRIDKVVTTPAKFAAGGVIEARKEFTLVATLLAIIHEYPSEIRWKHSAAYGRFIFSKMASNCKVGTQPVFNEAKQRTQDLQDLLKGSKLAGQAEEVAWEETSDRTPSMKILDWALRENLAPKTANEREFQQSKDEVKKYAELVAAYGVVMQQKGMNDADDETYIQFAQSMVEAAKAAAVAASSGDAEGARLSVGKIDQSCTKCHESYR